MAKVLVTGAAGFMGSHLVERLIKDGHDVVGVVDNLLGGTPANLANVADKIVLRHADCCDLGVMTMFMKGVDLVYHLAAAPHEGLSVFSPVVINKNTYTSTIVTATAAIRQGVKRFVFTSSNARYGKGRPADDIAQWPYREEPKGSGRWKHVPPDFSPFREDMEPCPVDPYGIAKVAAERTLLCLGKTHGMEVVIAVPHNVYGPRQKYDDPYRNVVGIMMNMILQGRKPIIYGDGKQQRCFTYIDDAINPLVEMGVRPASDVDRMVINIGQDHDPATVLYLSRLVCQAMDVEWEVDHRPDRPCEVKQAWPSSDRARSLLGYKTTVDLGDGIARMAAWIKTQGPRPFRYHLPLEIVNDKTPVTWKERQF